MAKSISRRLADSASPTGAIDGTLSTAAQTNITSVGTLSALTVSGALTVDTNTLVVDSTNNRVGIGTSSPTQELEIKAASVPTLKLNQAGTYGAEIALRGNDLDIAGSANAIVLYTGGNNDVSTTERMRIDSAGNVGIGTSSPATQLFVKSPSNAANVFAIESADASQRLQIGVNTSNGGSYIFEQKAQALRFGTSDTERMRIASNGTISIPNQNAINELSFTGTEFTNIVSATTSGFEIGTTGAGYLRFLTNNTERLRIDSAGNVGIGTTSPNSYSGYTALTLNHATNGGVLDFELNGNLQGELYANSANLGLGLQAVGNRYIEFQTNGTVRATIDGTGKVDIHDVGTVYTGAGHGKGTIHLDPNTTTAFAGNAITFGASDQGGGQAAQAGIYTRTDGTIGTEMHLSTTDSYAAGSKTGIKISNLGNVTVPRGYMSAKQPAAIVRGQGTFLSPPTTGWNEFHSIVDFTVYTQSSDSPWSDTTGRFTAPIAGYYLCTCSAYIHNANGQTFASQYLHPQWARNGSVSIMGQTPYQIFGHNETSSSGTAYTEGMGRSDVVKCDAGDYLTMQIFVQASNWKFYGNYCMLSFTFLAAD